MAVSEHGLFIALSRNFMSHMTSHENRSWLGTEQGHDAFGNDLLGLVFEQVEKRHGINEAELPGKVLDQRRVLVENIRLDKRRFQAVPVVE